MTRPDADRNTDLELEPFESNRDEPPTTATRILPTNDPERLGELFRCLEPRLTAVALRFTRDPETARDVVQSAFEKAVRHGHSFRGQSRVATWMHRIVANEALMWLRSERRRSEIPHDDEEPEQRLADAGSDPAELFDQRQRAQRLRDGLRRLSREERDVVLRCSLAGVSYAEYGARHGLHPAAVKSRAFRARRRLSDLLSQSELQPA
jgi:RNA polymerase sigma factor (sigma-70 family)